MRVGQQLMDAAADGRLEEALRREVGWLTSQRAEGAWWTCQNATHRYIVELLCNQLFSERGVLFFGDRAALSGAVLLCNLMGSWNLEA